MSTSYEEYLDSLEWRTKATIMKDIAQHGCEYCGTQALQPLHVHHLHYNSLGNESPQDLVVLCKSCHKNVHDGYDIPTSDDLQLIADRHADDFEDIIVFEYRANGWSYDFVPEPREDRLPGEMES